MMFARYRRDYDGEFVVVKTTLRNGQREEQREWIPNAIDNHHISGRGAVIGSDNDIEKFDFTRLQKHKGGLLGKKRLQTYGTDVLWEKMFFDFFICTDRAQANAIEEAEYESKSTVYTTSSICLEHPGRFYLIPFQPMLDRLAIAAYVAAFDGHQEVFLLGYNNDTIGITSSWRDDVNKVFQAYTDTRFYLVGTEGNMPIEWRANNNVSCQTYREFVTYCDV